MNKLYYNSGEGTNQILYTNDAKPDLWLLASKGKKSIATNQFIENLIDIAADLDDDLFSEEVATMVINIGEYDGEELLIDCADSKGNIDDLKKMVAEYDYEHVFGSYEPKIEYYSTADAEEYFKEHQKKYRKQYQNVTKILVIINVIVFLVNYIFGYSFYQFIFGALLITSPRTWLSILLAGFTHFSIMHIFFNMSFLLSVGPMLEQLLGRSKFLALYFISLFVSGLVVVVFGNDLAMTAGASGALYGLFAYFVCYMLKYGTDPIHKRNVLSTFGINVLITFLIPGISIAGHIGGAIAGVVIFYINESRR